MQLHSQRAFTLIEAGITLFIIGVLIAMALPMLKSFIYRTDDELLRSQLLRAIELARQEARARGVSTVICKSDDYIHCQSNAKNSLIVFLNENADGMLHAKEQLLAVMQTTAFRGNLNWRVFPNHREYLLFSAMAIAQTNNGTFWYCHTSAASPAWAVVLNKSGRTRVAYPNKKGEIKDGEGHLLRCT